MFRKHFITPLRLFMLALVVLPGLALATTTYLPRYLIEGYPAPRWPAAGAHVTVEGAAKSLPFTMPASGSTSLTSWAQQLSDVSKTKALLVYQKGQLNLEYYADDASANTRFNSYSMAKSLVGALVLKALAEKRINSLDEPIGRYLPLLADSSVRARPIRAFLTMRSGLDFENGGKKNGTQMPQKLTRIEKFSPFSHLAHLHAQGLTAVSSELHVDPARVGKFDYQNVNTAILGAVLENAYSQPLERLLSQKIWKPAGAANAHWRRYSANKPVSPYCCVYATARDWLRIGIFLAHNGINGNAFLPLPLWREWFGIGLSQQQLAANHYGKHIYHNLLNRQGEPLQGPFTFMFGSGGQIIYMKPQDDLVVVRLGEKAPLLHSTLYAAYRSATHQPKTRH